MRRFRSLQRGDTIVEVLLAMAVVGMVLGLAYGITNRSIAIGRSAQERSEALKLAETQVELLKEYISQNASATDSAMDTLVDDLALIGGGLPAAVDSACFSIDGSGNVVINKVEDSLTTEGDACEFGGRYQVTTVCMSGVPNNNASLIAKTQTCSASSGQAERKIIVRVTWDRIGGGLLDDGAGNTISARDNLDIYYRYGE